ncbi:ankyrin repeat-containing domain protein [Baffinella frigidus]|nr:ankyrin repeat-containing domain protein [Cryptophyta sp. CCMP2293]
MHRRSKGTRRSMMLWQGAIPRLSRCCWTRAPTPTSRQGMGNIPFISVKSKDGATPLHDAVQEGRCATVQLLLDAGAGINAKSNKGATPLLQASEEGHGPVVQILLDKGADIHAKTKLWATPLHRAAEEGRSAVVQILLDQGGDVRARTRALETPQDLASARGHEQVAAVLRAVATRRAKCEAFAMGQHKRLGLGSHLVRDLDPALVRMILDQVLV